MTSKKQITREEWLRHAARELRVLFKDIAELPDTFEVSCGFPGGGSPRKRIGECWARRTTAADVHQVFISPVLEDRVEVLSTLLHEMIHVADDNKSGHKGAFKAAAMALGFNMPMTSTPASDELKERLSQIADKIEKRHGEYPHKAIKLGAKGRSSKKQWHKVYCDCGWYCRMNVKHINAGLPICPVCDNDTTCDTA